MRLHASKTGLSTPVAFLTIVPRRFLFCESSLCASVVSHVPFALSLFVPHLPFFDASGRICLVIVAFLGYLHLHFA